MEIPQPVQNLTVTHTQIFINNEFVNSASGKTFATYNPCNGEKICDIQEADKVDAERAIRAARAAFALSSPWRRMTVSDRSKLLMKLADLIDRDRCYLATLETLDTGKPFKVTYSSDVLSAADTLRYYAGWADKITGQTIPVDGDYLCYTRLEPVGVVAAITPWNYPLSICIGKLAPALACGCTVIMKPPEQTPLTALHAAALAREAGFPPGVINVLPGFGPTAGAALVASLDVDKVTFTGSTEVGKLIMRTSGETNLKRVTLELGGKSPNIIFPDADLDDAVEQSGIRGVFNNSGQVCCALTRTYVHEDIYDQFVQKAAQLAQRQRELVGDPFDQKNSYGPQVDGDQLARIEELVASGNKQGARLVAGGNRIGTKGFFFEPTVFADVTEDMRIAKEEIFGPVQSIFKFKTMDEAIEKANATTYGLAASVFTKNIDRAITFANSVNAGSVWINFALGVRNQAPFGGYKMSGVGRENGSDGIKHYCEIKNIMVKINPDVGAK